MSKLKDCSMPINETVLKKTMLTVARHLSKAQLTGLAEELRCRLVEDRLTGDLMAYFHTFLLGGNFQTVSLEEELRLPVPATWWDHLQEAILHWLMERRAPRRLRSWLAERIQYVYLTKRCSKTEKVATHLCPHLHVPGDHRGEMVHITWMDGDVEKAAALEEGLRCSDRLN